jgi:hypothetical protein
LGESLAVCGVGSGAQFAVDFVFIGVGEELVEEGVGRFVIFLRNRGHGKLG